MKIEDFAASDVSEGQDGPEPLVITLAELVEAVGSFTDEDTEVAAVVEHVLRTWLARWEREGHA